MVKVTVEINNPLIVAIFTSAVQKTVRRVSDAIVDRMDRSFDEPKSGRFYRRRDVGGGTRIHRASARGEPPARDTGFLARTIEPTFPSATEGLIEIAAPYAERLEFEMDRFFVRPAIRHAIQQLESNSNSVLPGIP